MSILGIVAVVIAVISLIVSTASLIVTYQTLKDWDKIRGFNRRLEDLERKVLDQEDV